MRSRYRRNFCLPNYTPNGWWECDVFEITAAGFFREYEIKLTLGDFKADARKAHHTYSYNGGRMTRGATRTKHSQLAAHDVKGPTQFWYVAPKGLLSAFDAASLNPECVVPEWAGLIELECKSYGWTTVLTKRAPRLHLYKVSDGLNLHARTIPYWRMHQLLLDKRRND